MLTKFETKSNRVKGVAFHCARPWVLASLHNGVVQLWDYRMGTLIDRFDEHDGPVRGVHFHVAQPLFVTGGDDYKIKVWNYKLRRCLFTLLGHLDYIRTVQFHHELPWIVSASDDQTIRIWNWQSRSCVSVLTGHNHYVMCAQFHPKEDLVLSASLDQTVRVWDTSGLRKKLASPGGAANPPSDLMGGDDGRGGASAASALHAAGKLGSKLPQVEDLFGGNDATVKYVLEGHDRGVNWAAFHPTLPLIVSGADDRQVKLWRMNETKAWEVDTLRGHINNVSCAVFHPKQELIVSNSEDKSIRVWDMSKRQGMQTFRREHDRFWILAVHPTQNLLGAGHDAGLIVFKLERERPPYVPLGSSLLFIKERTLRSYEYANGKDAALLSIRRSSASSGGHSASSVVRSMHFNEAESMLLVCTDTEGGTYELYHVPRDARSGGGAGGAADAGECKRGLGSSGVFVARQRFAVLDKNRQIVIKNFQNEVTKKCAPPHPTTDMLFPAATGTLLLRADERITLFDVQQRKSVGELTAPAVKYVVWSADMSHVALLAKHAVVLANKRLQHLATLHETIRLKSGVWDGNGTFLYSTLNHLKYALTNGDGGIIRTLEQPLYLTKFTNGKLYCLDREAKVRVLQVDTSELAFKLALHNQQFDLVLRTIRRSKLRGHAIIAYLQKKGFPQVALHFVTDPQVRFNLAIECGHIELALEATSSIESKENWQRLAVEALRQGNHQVVEMCYQKTKDFERLSFLYLITGNTEKLAKMLKIAEMRADALSRFHNALYLGNARERVAVLAEVGQPALAYVLAKTHGLDEQAAELAVALGDAVPELPCATPKLLAPPMAIMREANWPQLAVSKDFWENMSSSEKAAGGGMAMGLDDPLDDAGGAGSGGGWGGDDLDLDLDPTMPPGGGLGDELGGGGVGGADPDEAGGGWEMEDALELPDMPALPASGGAGAGYFAAPTSGQSAADRWARDSPLAADHFAAGSFDSGMAMLQRQLGIINFAPLKPYALALAGASHALRHGPVSTPPVLTPLTREGTAPRNGGTLPALSITLPTLVERLRLGYTSTTGGKFVEALGHFRFVLQAITLCAVDSRKAVAELKELQSICKEYITAIQIELARKEATEPKRQAELSAYFTHCQMQPAHAILSLRSAMTVAYKMRNFNAAASFSRRLLDLHPKAEIATQARKVLQLCEQNPGDAVPLEYDDRNPFVVCNASFTPIYKGSKLERCSYCGAAYKPENKGRLCDVCNLGEAGGEATGLVCYANQLTDVD